jgi:transcriptional regulator with XRE-family HTH domain
MPAAKGLTVPHLRGWRLYKGLEQEELGRLAGVTPTTISRLENGATARIGTIRRLAEALKIDREELLHSKAPEGERPAA